jgi:hypothetical protein
VETTEPAGTTTDGWGEPGWADRGESTRVLPTDWTPPSPERSDELPELSAGAIRTGLADPDADLEPEEAGTIAEQAVPWLIGVILLLAGMVIVLLALIFAGDGSLGGQGAASPSPTQSPTLAALGGSLTPAPSPSVTPVASVTPSSTPTPAPSATPEPAPEYGPLEMVYQGRSAALAPIYLLRHDFTVDDEPDVLAQDAQLDVRRFAWSPDGRYGAGLLADVLVSIEPGEAKRRLGDELGTITFGEDGSTVYAVRITEDGADDVATVLAIDFESGDTEDLASITYERPDVGAEAALDEARFADEGGAVRLFWTAEDRLHLWILGAGAWTIDPTDGAASELDGAPLPVLWSPDGHSRIELNEEDGTTTLTLRNANARALASTDVDGMVSHVRWSPRSDRVVFTVGRSAAGGGIIQDLFLWDLKDGVAPTQITSTGAAFGAEWLGARPLWREE